jgi:gluconate 5-dehydrogenase
MNPPAFSLSGRLALVTGSSQGIGLALATALAVAGASVILNGRDAAKLNAAAATLHAQGHTVATLAFDVTDETAVDRAFATIARDHGPLDILVNNTGIHRRAPLADMTLADWNAVIETNLTSAFLAGRAAARGMIPRRAGKIINICSLMSDLARPSTGNYAAAKGGLRMLTRAMCAEWAPHNIQVNALAPGYILTDLTASLAGDSGFDSWVRSRTPAARWGSPADLAGACVFLSSSASAFVNGQLLVIDGGLSAVV